MPRIILRGDTDKAGDLIGWAKTKLDFLKRGMSLLRLKQSQRRYDFPDGSQVLVSSMFDQELIDIYAVAKGRGLFVICYVGKDTAHFTKKYYQIVGDTLKEVTKSDIEQTKNKTLIDDGAYGIVWNGHSYSDPFLYTYTAYGDGLNIPAIGKGVSAKQIKKDIRYILTTQQEDEIFWGQSIIFEGSTIFRDDFLILTDSLCYAPYSIKTTQPQFNRYQGNEVIFNNIISGSIGSGNILLLLMYHDKNFFDSFCRIPRIYKMKFDGTKDYVELEDYTNSIDAIISGYNYSAEKSEIQKIIRPKTSLWYTDTMGEPIRTESYNMTTKQFTTGDTIYRCSDPTNDKCFMLSSWLVSNETMDDNYYRTNTGYETISDDVKLPFALLEDGKTDYVRFQKHLEDTINDIVDYNTGIYCADKLVEQSGWKSVLQLYTDSEVAGYPAGAYAPILIFPVRYRPLHAYHSKNFDILLYRKTTYNGYNTELIPYCAYRSLPADYFQVRKTQIKSTTTYHISVNGKKTDLDYQCKNMEYCLTTLPTPVDDYSGLSLVWYLTDTPWADVNYDGDGNYLNKKDYNLTRIFSDSIGSKLLVGFDIFPVKFRNNLVYNSEDKILYPEYDDSETSFMPNSDRFDIKDRKWLLFDTKGSYKEITPPQKIVGETMVNWERINGMAVI